MALNGGEFKSVRIEELMNGVAPFDSSPPSSSIVNGSQLDLRRSPFASKFQSALEELLILAQSVHATTLRSNCKPVQVFWLIDNGLRTWFLSRPNWSPEEFLQLSQAFRCVYSTWLFCWKEASEIQRRVKKTESEPETKIEQTDVDIETLRNPESASSSVFGFFFPVTKPGSIAWDIADPISTWFESVFSSKPPPANPLKVLPAKKLEHDPEAAVVDLALSPNDPDAFASSPDQISQRIIRLKEMLARVMNIKDILAPEAVWSLIVEDYVWQTVEFLPSIAKCCQPKKISGMLQRLVIDPSGEYTPDGIITTGMCTIPVCQHGNEGLRCNPNTELTPREDLSTDLISDTQEVLVKAMKLPFWRLYRNLITGKEESLKTLPLEVTQFHFLSELSLFHHFGWLSAASASLPENISINVKQYPRISYNNMASSLSSYQWHVKKNSSDTCISISMPDKHLSLIVAIISAMASEIASVERHYEAEQFTDVQQDPTCFKMAECDAWKYLQPMRKHTNVADNTINTANNHLTLDSMLLGILNGQTDACFSSLDQIYLRNILQCYETCRTSEFETVNRRKLVICSPNCEKHRKEAVEDRWPEAATYLNNYPFLAVGMLRLMILPFGEMELIESQAEKRQRVDNIVYSHNIAVPNQTAFLSCIELNGERRFFGGDLVYSKNPPVRFYVK